MRNLESNTQIKFQIIRSARRTLSLEIARTGEVIVRATKYMPEAEIQKFVRDKFGWLQKHLQRRETQRNG